MFILYSGVSIFSCGDVFYRVMVLLMLVCGRLVRFMVSMFIDICLIIWLGWLLICIGVLLGVNCGYLLV